MFKALLEQQCFSIVSWALFRLRTVINLCWKTITICMLSVDIVLQMYRKNNHLIIGKIMSQNNYNKYKF